MLRQTLPIDDFTDRSLRWEREAFIPLHPNDLLKCLCHLQQAEMATLVAPTSAWQRLTHHLHQRYQLWQEEVTHLYAPLDPDRDLKLPPIATDSSLTNADRIVRVTELYRTLLEKANYIRLTDEEMLAAAHKASHWGVQIRPNFELFQLLEVYVRGDVIGQKSIRPWRKFFRKTEIDIPLYQRLTVLFRLSHNDHPSSDSPPPPDRLYFRMFKNIPRIDVDMLLPGAGVRMNWFDHSRILLPTIYGIGLTLWKIIKGTLVIALFGVFKTFGFVLLILAGIFYTTKSFFSYKQTRQRYLLNVTRSLYYQNLDNNQGVLLRLLLEGEQQELCEAYLALHILQQQPSKQGMTTEQVDQQCEQLVRELLGFQVDFDVENGLKNLQQCDLVQWHNNLWLLTE